MGVKKQEEKEKVSESKKSNQKKNPVTFVLLYIYDTFVESAHEQSLWQIHVSTIFEWCKIKKNFDLVGIDENFTFYILQKNMIPVIMKQSKLYFFALKIYSYKL